MKLIYFDIVLDKNGCTYEPGEEVSGRVLVNLRDPKAARGLKITIKGECNVRWTRSRTSRHNNARSNSRVEHISASENYLNLTYYLIGSEHGNSIIYFPAGEQSYPFRFQLPYEIPSSFEHMHGHVRYTLKAAIDRPWKFDHEATKQFTVVSKFDLNTQPAAALGIHDEDTVAFCCFCCFKVGDMDVRVTLPISGYVPGQNIKAKVRFDNRSRIDVDKIKFCLNQVMTFRVPNRIATRTAENSLREEKLKGPFGKSDEVTMNILVPRVPPSNMEFCNLIDMEYQLQVVIAIDGPHCNTRKTYPILIGTIPLNFVPFHVSTETVLPTVEEPNSTYLPKEGYLPMSQNVKLGFQNFEPEAGVMTSEDPMTAMPSTAPVPGSSIREIGFVTPSESPPPAYEECIMEPVQMGQDQDPNSNVDARQPSVP